MEETLLVVVFLLVSVTGIVLRVEKKSTIRGMKMSEREFGNFSDCVWQGADGSGSGSGTAGQRLATCCQNGGQEAEGVRCGEKSQRCHHVSGAHRLCCSS